MFKQAESAPFDAQKAAIRCKEKSRRSKCCHPEELPVIPEQAMEYLSRTWSPSSSDLFQILSPSVRLCPWTTASVSFQFSPTDCRHLLASDSIVLQSTYMQSNACTSSEHSTTLHVFLLGVHIFHRKVPIPPPPLFHCKDKDVLITMQLYLLC
jgi:hypothetical protein